MKNLDDQYEGNPKLIMTLGKWLAYNLNPMEIMFNTSAIDGSDFHQPMPLGMAVFLTDGMPSDPADFYTPQHPKVNQVRGFLANAIFSIETTAHVGKQRERAFAECKRNDTFVYLECGRKVQDRVSASHNINWYRNTPFTISPRGNGLDCHRTYEALIYGSVPIVVSNDESLRNKYKHLPVIFAPNYDGTLMRRKNLMDRHASMLATTYNFNYLTRTYWEQRRPDINILAQSVYWLKRFGKFDHVKRYFYPADQPTIDRINPELYPHPTQPKEFFLAS